MDLDTTPIDNFVRDITLGDVAFAIYLQRFLGYSATGHVLEQLFALWCGTGANGKGVLQNLLTKLFGKGRYVAQMPHNALIDTGRKRDMNSPSPAIMGLKGKRIAFIDETDATARLDEALVKNLTGNAAITARALHENMETFEPEFQVCMLTNHRPRFTGDKAMERRLLYFPFLAEFVDAHELDPTNPAHRLKDREIESKLGTEDNLSRLLTFVVRGAVQWYAEGLGALPDVMQSETERYLRDIDAVGEFLEAVCTIEPGAFVPKGELFDEFGKFAMTSVPFAEFKAQMERKGFKYGKNTTRGDFRMKTGFWGVKLKSPDLLADT